MTEKEKPLWACELNLMAAALRGLVTDPLIAVFWEEFQHVSLEDWRAACRKARRSLDFFPSVRELRSFLPYRERPNPELERLLMPYQRRETWPAQPLIGTPEFPRPEPPPEPESELQKAVAQRMRDMHQGNS
jgi:hypothetical protein